MSPNKEELAAIHAACVRLGCYASAEDALIEDFTHGLIGSIDELESYIAKRTYMFPTRQEVDLAREAFEGKGNVTARGKLVREIGKAAADRAAQEYGLRDANDFKTRGVKPDADGAKGADNKPQRKSDNPWSREGWNVTKQGALLRAAGPVKAAQVARAVGSFVGATRPADR